ncbi:MAG: BlaI/MecI/CopY family transcriptional regulator [Candidatus Methanomethylicia archaeon]|nr:BlaI/MecI/CopY family transcriptional regulator [Candidatus Methanomethylicia archaeon]
MSRKELFEKLSRIEYLLEYLSKEIEIIKRILGLGGDTNIFTLLEGGIEVYKIATSEYKRILNIENTIRNMKMDNLSKEILRIIAYMGPLNITQITMELRKRRGKSSRITVTKKLKELIKKKVVMEEIRGKEKLYYVNVKE